MWSSQPRRALVRGGQEAVATLSARYHVEIRDDDEIENDIDFRTPISASEIEGASDIIFQRSPTTPSDYVFSQTATVPLGQTGETIYPSLRHNQTLRNEVLAMGHRLAAQPAVQTAIMDDLMRNSQRLPPSLREIHPSLLSQPEDEEDSGRVVDILAAEEENPRSLLDGLGENDNEEELQDLELDPQVSEELRGAYAAARNEAWTSWSEEKSDDTSTSDETLGGRLSNEALNCSCRRCHQNKEEVSLEGVASDGDCWKEVVAEYECDICFDVLVGVYVLDNCGHHFCGACMERWMDNSHQGKCPVCRSPVDKLVPVRKMDEMVAKAVDAAAPSKERTAWFERRSHWEGTIRQRQESADRTRAGTRVQAAAAAATRNWQPGDVFSSWQQSGTNTAGSRGTGRGGEEGAGRERGGDGDEEGGRVRLTKMEAVLAVAVMLVMAVLKLRGFRR